MTKIPALPIDEILAVIEKHKPYSIELSSKHKGNIHIEIGLRDGKAERANAKKLDGIYFAGCKPFSKLISLYKIEDGITKLADSFSISGSISNFSYEQHHEDHRLACEISTEILGIVPDFYEG